MADTKKVGVASRGGDSGADRETGTPEIHTCKYTGEQYTVTANGWRKPILWPSDLIKLRYETPGVTATRLTSMIRWDFVRNEPIDEADARDAQCRAGWSDVGYGFYGFKAEKRGNQYIATWASGVSCE